MAITVAQPLPHATPAQLFRERCRMWSDLPALRRKQKGIWHSVSWREYFERAQAVGMALLNDGLVRGDVIAVLAENRPEWLYADMGAQCVGILGNGIYPTSSPEQVRYALADSGARVLFVENEEQLDKALAVRAACPRLQKLVVMDDKGLRSFADTGVVHFADYLASGLVLAGAQPKVFDDAIDAGQAHDIAFLVYTSGTTGAPKGAMVSNANLIYQIGVVPTYAPLAVGDKTLSFLPLCHIAERMTSMFNPLAIGQIVHFPENSSTIFNDMREVAPHLVFGPPRFWEKLYAQIELFMQDAIVPARHAYRIAFADGTAIADGRLAGRSATAGQTLRFSLLGRFALANIKDALGLQNVKCALTGAAPVPPDLLRWYMAIGIDLREAFGMTETCGFCTATPVDRIKIGYAGIKAPGTDIKIGADGEVLVRGPNVFAGYWNLPEKTAETIDADGWLHTGDAGEIDTDGYLKITDRMKDIIITSGGKNISPSGIESQLKFSPYVSDAVVIGEGRNYLTALIMIDQDTVSKFAQDAHIPFTDFASLTRTDAVRQLVHRTIEEVNAKLARVEQIKDFRIIEELLTAEDEELTPTMKLKRRVVTRRHAERIASMYEAAMPGAGPHDTTRQDAVNARAS